MASLTVRKKGGSTFIIGRRPGKPIASGADFATEPHELSALPFRRFLALVAMIALAIVLRRYGPAHGLSPFMVRLGAGALWAAAIYFVVALLLRSRPRKQVFIVAAALCALIELSKLSHTPALDIFRLTPVGAWVLGKSSPGPISRPMRRA